jgi:hypothetical protein
VVVVVVVVVASVVVEDAVVDLKIAKFTFNFSDTSNTSIL